MRLIEGPLKATPDETRARILAAARELFALKGTRGTTTREVADRAGVNEATVFRHFGTKHALLHEMLDHYCESRDQMRGTMESMEGTLAEQLRSIGLMAIDGIRRKEDLIRIGLAEQVADPDASAMTWRTPVGALSLLSEFMQKRIDAGELSGDAETLARVFMSFWFSYVLGRKIWNYPDDQAERDRVVGQCVEILLERSTHALMDTTQAPAAGAARGPSAPTAPPAARNVPPERTARSPIVRTIVIIVVAIAVLLALIFGIRYLLYAMSHETTDDAKIDADQVQITSKIAERVDRIVVDTNQYVHKGQLLIQLDDVDERAKLATAIATRDAYNAQARAAQSNVSLTRDQQSAQNEQSQGAIAAARAAVSSAGSQATSAQAQVNVAIAGIADAQAQLKAAQSAVPGALQNLRKAQADLQRTSSLVATGDIARSQLDAATAAEKAAESSYNQAEANVGAAQANVASANDKLAAQQAAANGAQSVVAQNEGNVVTAEGKLAESASPYRITTQEANAGASGAQVNTAESQVKIAQDNLSYTQIRSPIDGYVGQKNAEVGQTVSPGISLLTIVPATNIYITANYKETQLRHIRVGQPVDINVDAYSGVKFEGYVDNIAPASQNTFALVPAQNASGNFVKVTQRLPIRVRFKDPDPHFALRPGMSVETSVKVK